MSEIKNTGEREISRSKDEIIKECKRIEESCLFSSKGHFQAAEKLTNLHLWLGLPIAILSAVASVLAFSQQYLIAGFISLLIAILSAILTFINPNEKATIHQNAGNNYDALLNKARIFRTIECWAENLSDQVLSERVKEISDEKNRLNRSSPHIPNSAYKAAKKAIEEGQGNYAVDKNKKSDEVKNS